MTTFPIAAGWRPCIECPFLELSHFGTGKGHSKPQIYLSQKFTVSNVGPINRHLRIRISVLHSATILAGEIMNEMTRERLNGSYI